MSVLRILCIPDRRFPTNQSFLEHVLAKILPARGHQVTWIVQSEAPLKEKRRLRWHASDVLLLPAKTRKNSLCKLINWLWRTVGTLTCLHRFLSTSSTDTIHVRNDWISALYAGLLRRKYGVPVVYQYSRPGPEFRLQLAQIQAASVFSSLWLRCCRSLERRLVNLAMSQADHILPISKWMKEQLIMEGVPSGRMTSIPLGFDVTLKPKMFSRRDVRAKLALGDAPIVIYFGSMDPLRKLDFLLRTMQCVVNAIASAKLLMVGREHNDRVRPRRQVKQMGLESHVVIKMWVTRIELCSYLATADVGVSPIPPLPIYWISSPTKLVETLGMARPVVANDIPDQKKVLEESGGGLCVPYEEGPFADAIVQNGVST